MFTMATAVLINFFTFYYIINHRKVGVLNNLQVASRNDISLSLIIGSLIYGVGWGISGLCPGPALVTSVIYIPHVLLYLAFILIGQFAAVYTEILIDKKTVSDAYNAIDS